MRISGWCQSRCRPFEVCKRSTWRHSTICLGRQRRALGAIQLNSAISRTAVRTFFDFKIPETPKVKTETGLSDVLSRALAYGIESEQKLAFEAEVGHRHDVGSRMIDHPVNRQDLELWIILLHFRRLQHGDRGVQDILYGMRFRGDPVKLYADDLLSEQIWDIFFSTSTRNEDVLYQICNPVHGIGREIPTLFLDTVSRLLEQGRFPQAERVARLLRKSHFRGYADLLELFKVSYESDVPMSEFCNIHKCLAFVQIYADVLSKLWEDNRSSDAWLVHSYLISRGDLPTRFQQIEPLVRDLAQRKKPLGPFLRELEQAGASFSTQAQQVYAEESANYLLIPEKMLDTTRTNIQGTRPHRLKDEFVARAFATSSVSFDFMLNSLRFFGLIEVGPLAVREMALSSKDLQTLRARFQKLKDLEIDLGSSAFVTIVQNLCASGSEVLLQAVLDSDQHHDVVEDREMQKRLLAGYYYQQDWPQVNRTLTILNRGRTGLEAQRQSARLLLLSSMIIRDWRGALNILAGIEKHGHWSDTVSRKDPVHMSLNSVIEAVVPSSRQIRHQKQEYLERGAFLVGLLQDMMSLGMYVAPAHWRKVLFFLGDSHCMDELERLAVWLGWYYRRKANRSHADPQFHHRYEVALDKLFDPVFQAAVIEWNFCLLPETDLQLEKTRNKAERGMRLLRKLHQWFSVSAAYEPVREAYVSRLHRICREQDDVRLQTMFFDSIWINDISKMPRWKDRALAARRNPPTPDDLQYLRDSARAYTVSEQIEDDRLMRQSDLFQDTDTDSESEAPDRGTRSSAGDDDVVEYQDIFHPSWKEYRR